MLSFGTGRSERHSDSAPRKVEVLEEFHLRIAVRRPRRLCLSVCEGALGMAGLPSFGPVKGSGKSELSPYKEQAPYTLESRVVRRPLATPPADDAASKDDVLEYNCWFRYRHGVRLAHGAKACSRWPGRSPLPKKERWLWCQLCRQRCGLVGRAEGHLEAEDTFRLLCLSRWQSRRPLEPLEES